MNAQERETEQGAVAFPQWKRWVLGLALLAACSGFAMARLGGDAATGGRDGDGGTPVNQANQASPANSAALGSELIAPSSLAPRAESTGPGLVAVGSVQAPEPEPQPWSPLLFKGGLSVIGGFCVGFALRAFLKVTAIATGVLLIALLGLQYAGWIEVDWNALSGAYERVSARVSSELQSMRDFIAGVVPSAGLAGVGFFTGFKRSS